MKRIYIAKRIPKNPDPQLVLNVTKDMSVQQVSDLYVGKLLDKGTYMYNGPWILRAPVSDNDFSINNMPQGLETHHIWAMVKEKIESSDVFLGIVSNGAYGTFAETGYACCRPNIAVYVLPELGVSVDELQDFWFVLQIAKNTQHHWCDEDIKVLKEFSEQGITTLAEYETYLLGIIPKFMKK